MTQAIITKRDGGYVITAAGAEVVASLLAQAKAALEGVQPVLDDLENVNTVADSIANVNLVGASIANVNSVAGALTNIGTVASNIASVNTVAGDITNVNTVATDLALGAGASFILRAPQAAIDAAAAAASVVRQAPAYANSLGQGDRTATIVVTATAGLINSGTTSNLVDGATANNTTDSVTFVSSVAVAGKEITFDFGDGASKIITEATFKQSTTASHGTWKFQLSNDNGGRVDIGTSFTLGGSTSQALTQLSTNVLGYRYLHIVGVSGNASGSPFVQEFEFKIAATDSDGKPVIPIDTSARNVLVKSSASARTWRNLDLLDGFPTTGLQADWEMITDGGVTVRDRFGNNDITLASGSNITIRAGFLHTAAGRVITPSFTSATTIVMLVRVPRTTYDDVTRTGFLVSCHTNGGVGIQENTMTTTDVVHLGGMQGTIHSVGLDSGGTKHVGIRTGHWRLVFYQPTAAATGIIGFGGRTTSGSTCADYDIMRASVYTGSALSGADRLAIFNSYRRTAEKYGVALTADDCADSADFVADLGESNCDGRAPISGLSAANQALVTPETLIMASNASTYAKGLRQLIIGLNEQATAPTTDFGPAFGLAVACRADAMARYRRLIVGKVGVGGSRLAPSSVGGTATSTWSPSQTIQQPGIIWRALEHLYAVQAASLARGIGPRPVGSMFAIGLNDAVNTIYASSDTVYQGYLQGFYDFWVTWGIFPAAGYKMALFRPHTTDPVSNATALANIRSGCALFAAAQSGVTNIDTDAYPKIADNVHWNATAMVSNAGPSAKTALGL